mgnify:CR=1 FL=1
MRETKLWHSTTIICVKKDDEVAMAGDGQVTFGDMVVKSNAVKIRKLYKNTVLSGFAGSAADAFALLERFEMKLEKFSGDLLRASVTLAKDWRLDKALRHLDAMLIVADKQNVFVISGDGNVLEPEEPVTAIGSGAGFAKAAALAFLKANPQMSVGNIARQSLEITSKICIYTNSNIIVEIL